MTVNNLKLEHFRNYACLEAAFHPGVNVICGDNAQGKTNLLEAIFYLSSASSHRARYDRELITFGEEHAFLEGDLFSRRREISVKISLHRGARRQLLSNGVKLKTAGELSGILQTVLFCPEDLQLVREGAAARRRFLDDCICQLRPRYAAALAEYKRLYEHKVRILRDSGERPDLLDALEDFSARMAQCGAVIIHYRAHFIKRLKETAPSLHRECAGGREELEIQYHTVSTVSDPEAPPKELLPQLLEHQRLRKQAEMESRSCLSGPHKDDLVLLLDGVNAREFSSQGQARTAALSLKLSARDIFYQDTGEWPVLLLDDVLSELDPRRQEYVVNRIGAGQVFISCCEEEKGALLREGAVFRVAKGVLTQL